MSTARFKPDMVLIYFNAENLKPDDDYQYSFAVGVLEALEQYGSTEEHNQEVEAEEFLYELDVSSILSELGLMKTKDEWDREQRPGRWIRPVGSKK